MLVDEAGDRTDAVERLLVFAQFGQQVDEHVRHRDAAGEREPAAPRDAIEQPKPAGEGVDGGQRDGEEGGQKAHTGCRNHGTIRLRPAIGRRSTGLSRPFHFSK